MLISIVLRITGDFLDPEEITRIIGVSPHISRRKGDIRVHSSNKQIVSKFGLWEWQSLHTPETTTINDHINHIRSTFAHAYGLLPNLPKAENAWLDVHIVDGDGDENVSKVWFLMDIETISTLHNIGLPVEFTVDILPAARCE